MKGRTNSNTPILLVISRPSAGNFGVSLRFHGVGLRAFHGFAPATVLVEIYSGGSSIFIYGGSLASDGLGSSPTALLLPRCVHIFTTVALVSFRNEEIVNIRTKMASRVGRRGPFFAHCSYLVMLQRTKVLHAWLVRSTLIETIPWNGH